MSDSKEKSLENSDAYSSSKILLYACSGASDLGGLVDQAARKITQNGTGKMHCLAGIGGQVTSILTDAKSANIIMALDGCAKNCAAESLKKAGLNIDFHLELTRDMGFIKGQTVINTVSIDKVVKKAESIISQ